jgi:polyhydroxyalkanoate synthesis regulator phasin
LPLDRAAQLDSEIERRMQLLIERGEISTRQGNQILEKLLAVHPVTRSPEELKIERALEKRGTPTRSDIQMLSEQINALSNELKQLDLKETKRKRKATTTKNAAP